MNEGEVGALLHEGVVVMLKIGGPPLLAALVVGIVMALLQAITQVNDAAVVFVPKVLALAAVLILAGPFMMATLAAYANGLFDRLIAIGGS